MLLHYNLDFEAEDGASFTDRLVTKFGLPVSGWRGRGESRLRAVLQRAEERSGDA